MGSAGLLEWGREGAGVGRLSGCAHFAQAIRTSPKAVKRTGARRGHPARSVGFRRTLSGPLGGAIPDPERVASMFGGGGGVRTIKAASVYLEIRTRNLPAAGGRGRAPVTHRTEKAPRKFFWAGIFYLLRPLACVPLERLKHPHPHTHTIELTAERYIGLSRCKGCHYGHAVPTRLRPICVRTLDPQAQLSPGKEPQPVLVVTPTRRISLLSAEVRPHSRGLQFTWEQPHDTTEPRLLIRDDVGLASRRLAPAPRERRPALCCTPAPASARPPSHARPQPRPDLERPADYRTPGGRLPEGRPVSVDSSGGEHSSQPASNDGTEGSRRGAPGRLLPGPREGRSRVGRDSPPPRGGAQHRRLPPPALRAHTNDGKEAGTFAPDSV